MFPLQDISQCVSPSTRTTRSHSFLFLVQSCVHRSDTSWFVRSLSLVSQNPGSKEPSQGPCMQCNWPKAHQIIEYVGSYGGGAYCSAAAMAWVSLSRGAVVNMVEGYTELPHTGCNRICMIRSQMDVLTSLSGGGAHWMQQDMHDQKDIVSAHIILNDHSLSCVNSQKVVGHT